MVEPIFCDLEKVLTWRKNTLALPNRRHSPGSCGSEDADSRCNFQLSRFLYLWRSARFISVLKIAFYVLSRHVKHVSEAASVPLYDEQHGTTMSC